MRIWAKIQGYDVKQDEIEKMERNRLSTCLGAKATELADGMTWGVKKENNQVTLNLFPPSSYAESDIIYPDRENWRRTTRFGVTVGGGI